MSADPGWYPDPAGQPWWRWWNGTQWAPEAGGYGYIQSPSALAVSTPPAVSPASADAPFPAAGPAAVGAGLPFRALWYAAGGLVGGFFLASIVAVICLASGLDTYSPVTVVGGLVSLWLFLAGSAVLASRRLGSGSLREDYRWGFKPIDAARGLGASVVGRLAVTVVTGVVLAIAGHKVTGNTEILRQQQGHPLRLVVIGAGAVIGAPIVEELFFRGLVLRALASKVPYWWAVAIQGLLFGLAHTQADKDGWTVVAVVAGTASFGMVQGYFASRWRLGALMVSHALYNLLPVLVIAFS